MTRQTIDAVYEGGVFRPIESPKVPDGQKVRITLEPQTDGGSDAILDLAAEVYAGLTQEEIKEVEAVALDRQDFFARRG